MRQRLLTLPTFCRLNLVSSTKYALLAISTERRVGTPTAFLCTTVGIPGGLSPRPGGTQPGAYSRGLTNKMEAAMEADSHGQTAAEQEAAHQKLEDRVASLLSTPGGAKVMSTFGGKDSCLLRMLRWVVIKYARKHPCLSARARCTTASQHYDMQGKEVRRGRRGHSGDRADW